MKLSKTSWLLLSIFISVVLFASLSMAYSQQGQEQSQLYHELSLAQQMLAKQSAKYSPEKFFSQQRELESQLARTESQLEDVKTNLRQLIESIEVTDTLFEVAQTHEAEIIEIRSSGVTSGALQGVACSVLSLTAKVEGDVPNLINFVLELSRKFPTGVVESVQIDIPEVTGDEGETGEESEEGETGEEEELERPSAILVLCIHTYEGD